MPNVIIPDKPQKNFSSLELSTSNLFGPGVSVVGGIVNPAGYRSGTVHTCTTTAQVNTAFANAGFGDDIVLTAGQTYIGNSADGGQFTPTAAPAITPSSPRMPPARPRTWSALAGLQETSPVAMTGTRPSVSGMTRMTAPGRQGEPSYIRVMSSGWASLPSGVARGSAGRILPSRDTANMPVLKSKRGGIVGRADCLYVARDTRYWRFEGIQLTVVDGGTFFDMIVDMGRWLEGGPTESDKNRVPHHFIFDRVWFNGQPVPTQGAGTGAFRGIHVGCPWLGILGCHFDGVMNDSAPDTQSIYIDVVPGPYHVENTYMDSASEDMMIGGGGGPSIWGFDAMTDFTCKQNFFTKNTRYYQDILPNATGTVNVSGTTVTGTGTNFSAMSGGRTPLYFYSPTTGAGNPIVPATVNAVLENGILTIVASKAALMSETERMAVEAMMHASKRPWRQVLPVEAKSFEVSVGTERGSICHDG